MMAFEAAFVKINETISNTYPFYLTTGILYFLLTLAILQFPSILYSKTQKEN
jgi:hypothetical protein